MQKYASKGGLIRINNYNGSIGQIMATPGGRRRVMAATNRLPPPKELQQLKMLSLREINNKKRKEITAKQNH
jgi:hypothetical protein